jgi:hypothetical protein
MNGNPYTSSWIGATQQYPIYEYANLLDSNQSNFVTKTSNTLHNEVDVTGLQVASGGINIADAGAAAAAVATQFADDFVEQNHF